MKRYVMPALLLILAACSDPSEAGPSSTPVALRSMVGDAQMATVATELPIELSATVVDASGAPVRNAVVSWVGDGSVFAPATGTGSDGVTRNQWTLDTRAGEQQMQARWVDPGTGVAHVLGTFTATGTPDVAATFTLAKESVTGFVGLELTADSVVGSVADRYGNATTRDGILLRAGEAPPAPLVRLETEGRHAVEVVAAVARDTVTALALLDLSQHRWSWHLECRIDHPSSEVPDSVFIALAETGVRYIDDPVTARFAFTDSATLTSHYPDGTVTAHRFLADGSHGIGESGGVLGLSYYGGMYYADDSVPTPTFRTQSETDAVSCGGHYGRGVGVIAPVF